MILQMVNLSNNVYVIIEFTLNPDSPPLKENVPSSSTFTKSSYKGLNENIEEEERLISLMMEDLRR